MVPIPEIATAWVTLAATTKGMEGDIRRAVKRAEGSAKINPKVNTSGLSAQASKAGKEFGDRFSNSAKTAMKALSVAVVGAGIVDQFRQVMSVGMDWQNNMNTLQAVTGATAQQLKSAGDAARALGNDISLPATSANDAASAMTELAKGGFNVQQSMDAAKGSLQLAAAAQIGAAEAATIQSQALQAFGLNAGDAGKIADTLANAANASSAEITDVAQAMAQAGTVAKQFGLSAEDTAAAIGLLANNGIKGSDAGTLLKSTLLALTDQGNPAQGAIEQLGLTVYDAQGKFVGLHELTEQLGRAAATMTNEQYQAATAVLFGSDAMRFAGVAAKDGSASYDQMRLAIDRQGAAADVAAAKTKGLPGAWERVKNAMESLQLKAFDVLQGPVSGVLDGMSKGLGDLQDKAVDVGPKIGAAWKQLTTNPVIVSTLKDTVGAFKSLASSAAALWPSLVQVGTSLAKASAALGISAWKIFVTALQAAAGVLNAVAPVLATIAGLMTDHQGAVVAAAGAWLLFKTIPALMGRITPALAPVMAGMQTLGQRATTAANGVGNFSSAYRTHMQYVRQANPTISTAATHIQTLGSVARYAGSGGLNALKGAASGVVGALGGPFSAALIGATVGIGLIASSSSEANRRTRDLADAQGELTAKTREMYELLTKSGGNTDSNVITKATEQFDVLNRKFDTLRSGASIGDWLRGVGSDMFGLGDFDIGDALDKQHGAEKIERLKSAMQDLGTTSQSMGVLISGSSEAWAEWERNARAAGDGGRELLAEMEPLRQQFLDQQAAARLLTPGFASVRDAIKTIADSASTAADKTNAFKTALDALAGVAPDVQDATANYNDTIRQISELQVDPSQGEVLQNKDGSVDTTTANGGQLLEQLKNMKAATEGVAGAGGDLQQALKRNDETLTVLAGKFGKTRAEIDAMAASYGYVPKRFEALFELRGADDAKQQLGVVRALLDTVAVGKPISLDAESVQAARGELEKTGLKLREFDGPGGRKKIEITAPNGQVLNNLDGIIDKLATIPRNIVITASATPGAGQGIGQTGNSGQTIGERQRERRGRADGAIVPMADGGFRQITKPRDADIYDGRGAGTIFAEEETGGEAYIPLAPGKRPRSKRILSEVARLFGMNMMAEGGISVDSLKDMASQLSGGSYVRGGPPGPSGTDCSGAQAWIANMLTGGSGRFSTKDEAQALLSRGFVQGDPPPGVAAYWVGWKNGGPGGGHTAGTIVDPEGGNVNVEMGGSSGGGAFGSGAAGASEFPNRAWIQVAGGEDPNAASDFSGSLSGGGGGQMTRTQSRQLRDAQQKVDDKNVAVEAAQKNYDDVMAKEDATEKQKTAATTRLTKAQREAADATDDLADKQQDIADKLNKDGSKSDNGGMDGQSLGQGIFSGILQSIGLDGSLFSNPFDWPNVKSAMAALNWGGGLLKGVLGGTEETSGTDTSSGIGGGFASGVGLPNFADFLKPIGPQAVNPIDPNTATHGQAGGGAPGPVVNYTMNGVDPKAGFQQADAHANQVYRGSGLPAVRPR